MSVLLPRLSPAAIPRLMDLARANELTPESASAVTFQAQKHILWAATGGRRDFSMFSRIASDLRKVARECGFPNKSNDNHREFDISAAKAFSQERAFESGEALRNDVWACLSFVGAPDVALWRFPNVNPERLGGGVRNVFQRLWVRGVSLDLGPTSAERWMLVEKLSEDAMVQIFERPVISRDRRLAKALAKSWVAVATQYGAQTMEKRMRHAVRRVRVRNVIQGLSLLDDAELESLLSSFFHVEN